MHLTLRCPPLPRPSHRFVTSPTFFILFPWESRRSWPARVWPWGRPWWPRQRDTRDGPAGPAGPSSVNIDLVTASAFSLSPAHHNARRGKERRLEGWPDLLASAGAAAQRDSAHLRPGGSIHRPRCSEPRPPRGRVWSGTGVAVPRPGGRRRPQLCSRTRARTPGVAQGVITSAYR